MCRYYMKINYIYIYIFVVFPWFISTKRDREGVLLSVPSGKLGKRIRNWLWNWKDVKRGRWGYPPTTCLAGGAAEEARLHRAQDCCAEEPVEVLLLLGCRCTCHYPLQAARSPYPHWCCRNPGAHSLLLQRLQLLLLELEPEASDCWGWRGTTSAAAVEWCCLSRTPEPAPTPAPLADAEKNHTDFSFPLAFESPNSAFHWQNLTRKQLERKSVRCSLQPPSQPVIQRRFQKAGNNAKWQIPAQRV